jgi:NAD(P)-dependent dehydrogenase (short-subunit alcohol dehydrogenase family)
MPSESKFKNKVVVITGGSQGIGKAMALGFAKLGAHIIICARTKTDLDQTKQEIVDDNGSCDAYVVDVSQHNHVALFFKKIIGSHKKIDVLICSSGIYGPLGALETNDMTHWKNAIDINLMGTVYCVHAALPQMKKQKCGTIITLCGGGVGSKNIKPNLSAYTSSKAAIALFTEVIAKEVLEDNIQINAISPGAVNTRLLDEVLHAGKSAGESFLDAAKKQKESGGTSPEKAVNLAIWLACHTTVTGKVLSALWDNYENLDFTHESLYNLRRIDQINFIEK